MTEEADARVREAIRFATGRRVARPRIGNQLRLQRKVIAVTATPVTETPVSETVEMTYRQAIAQAIIEEMELDPNVFLLGEDVGRVRAARWPPRRAFTHSSATAA